ncbi:MAG TPA: prepilin-type N-terminal cleavage/methylation domain-containing protein [Phycisphaerales bacterium]|nr:prepilin-type N-terminal cleavage/methylation domain-containing protein [Phycisphaerales bacterium]
MHAARQPVRVREARGRRAFTLLESLMALIVVGVGVLAFVDAQSSFHRSNGWSSRAATGMLLANELREFTRHLPRHDPVTGLTLNGATLTGWGRDTGETANATADIDDLDDLDGVTFGSGGTFPGPINAFGEVIPEVEINGDESISGGQTVPLVGWSQRVLVDKVDPYNFVTARADNYQQAASASLPFIPVDSFPLRVTVIVSHQGLSDSTATEVTRVSWVVPR